VSKFANPRLRQRALTQGLFRFSGTLSVRVSGRVKFVIITIQTDIRSEIVHCSLLVSFSMVPKQRQCLFCGRNLPLLNLASEPFAQGGFLLQHLQAFSGNLGRQTRKKVPLPGAARFYHHHEKRLEKTVCDQTRAKAVVATARLSVEQLSDRP